MHVAVIAAPAAGRTVFPGPAGHDAAPLVTASDSLSGSAPLTRAQERLAVAALALAAFALNLNTNVLGALQPFLPAAVLPTATSFSWLVSGAAWGSAAGALLVGPLADRVGRRAPLLWGTASFVVLSALHGVVSGFTALLALRVLSGVAVGVAYASASAIAAGLSPYERRGRTLGVFTAGMFLAIPVGLPIANWLAQSGHWPVIFLVQAAFAAIGLLCALAAVPDDRGAGVWIAPWNMLARPPVLATLVAVMLHVGSFFTTVQLATGWLDRTGLVRKADQGWLWIVLGFASALGSFALGRLSDRFGKRNFVLASSIVLLLCFGLIDERLDRGWFLALGLLLAVTAAARTGPLQALTSGLVPSYELGTLMGVRAFAMQAGVGSFALVAGGLEAGHGFGAVLLAAAACQAFVYLAIRFGVRERR